LKAYIPGGAADGSLRLSAALRIELNDALGEIALLKSVDEAGWPFESLIRVSRGERPPDQGLSYCPPARRLRQ
jgi:hypothetical protein